MLLTPYKLVTHATYRTVHSKLPKSIIFQNPTAPKIFRKFCNRIPTRPIAIHLSLSPLSHPQSPKPTKSRVRREELLTKLTLIQSAGSPKGRQEGRWPERSRSGREPSGWWSGLTLIVVGGRCSIASRTASRDASVTRERWHSVFV